MKNLASLFVKFATSSLCLLLCLMAHYAGADVQSWDPNGTTSIGGSGTWDDTTPNWTPNSPTTTQVDSGSLVTWTDGNAALFSAGPPGGTLQGPFTITVSGTRTISGFYNGWLDPDPNTLTLTGGELSLVSGLCAFGTYNCTTTINTPISGVGPIDFQGFGTVQLYANNTYNGGTQNSGDPLVYFNNSSSFGSGAITPRYVPGTPPGYLPLLSSGGALITLPNNFVIDTANAGINFANGALTPVTCTGNWDLQQTLFLKNNGNSADSGANLTLSGVLSGGGGLNVSGNNGGTIYLTGANTYTGPTTIALGAQSAAGVKLSVSSINSVSGGSPSSNLGAPTDVTSGTIGIGAGARAGILIYTGPSETTDRVIDLAGATGGATIQNDGTTGPLVFTSAFTASVAGAKTLTLQGANTANNKIAGAIVDSGSGNTALTKAQAGKWILAGANTYSGNTTVSAGTLAQGAANVIPYGTGKGNFASSSGATFDLGGFDCQINGFGTSAGTINNTSGTATLNIGYSGSGNSTHSGVIQNTAPGILNVTLDNMPSNATITLSGANGYSGITTIGKGVLQISSEANLGATPASPVANSIYLNNYIDGTVNYGLRLAGADATLTVNRGITLGPLGGAIQVQNARTLTINGVITGSGALWVSPNNAAGFGTLLLNNNNTYSGSTVLASGVLKLGVNGALPFGTPLTIGSSTQGGVTRGQLDMNGKSQTIANLATRDPGTAGGSTPSILLSGALTILETNNTTFGGVISSSGGSLTLDSTSTSTLTLISNNTYSGSTSINGGTLALSGSGAIGSSSTIAVARGGTFDVSARTTALTLGASQTLKAGGTSGSSATIATASGEGLILGASSPLQFTAYDGTTVPLTITGAGSLAIGTGNAVTVTTTTSLSPGSYKLVQIGSGNTTAVAGTPASSVSVNGSGIVSGTFASLRVTGGELYLDVQNLAPVTQMSIGPGGGGNLTISYSGGAGSQFVLLQTNNVAAPLRNWTRLQTNTLTTGSFTIIPGSDPAEFYRITSE